MKIKVAFYKGGEGWQHKIIRWWTKSVYSHAELVMPDNFTWISISPFLESKVSKRLKTDFDLEKWDFITINVTEEQHSSIMEFYENTKDNVYDWWGMLLSQFTPFKVKSKNKRRMQFKKFLCFSRNVRWWNFFWSSLCISRRK